MTNRAVAGAPTSGRAERTGPEATGLEATGAEGIGTERSSVEEHARLVAEALSVRVRRRVETVASTDALGRTTASDAVSTLDLPGFDNSQMDGYALRVDDLAGPTHAKAPTLPVSGVVAAGDDPGPLPPGSAVKIMTGAPIPEGADSVVPVEETDAPVQSPDRRATPHVAFTAPGSIAPGRFIRPAGSDLRAGEVVVPAGTTIRARHLGALVAAGVTDVDVLRAPRVAVVSTGTELVRPGSPLARGRIPDSNGPMLAALAREAGAEIVSLDHSSDDPDTFARILDTALDRADVVVTSGGVSMGDFEVVRDRLGPHGRFGTVAMQPGGPQGLATVRSVPVLCFPGNPVSALVSFTVFAAPVLRAAAGLPPTTRRTVPLAHPLRSLAGRRQFLRGRLVDGCATVEGGPGSHLVAALARADVLLDIPADTTELVAGDTVEVIVL